MSKQIIIDITEELINVFRVFLDHNQLQVEDENIDLLAQQITDVIKEKMPKPALPSKQNGDKPKRPLNAYILWSRKKRPEFKEQVEADDDIEKKDKGREVMRRLAAAWKEAKSDDEDEDVKAAKEEAAEQKEAYSNKQNGDKAKRPLNAYILWSRKKRPEIKEQVKADDDIEKKDKGREVMRRLAAAWQEAKSYDEDEDVKAAKEEADEQKEAYTETMKDVPAREKVKRGPNSYHVWSKAHRKDVIAQMTEENGGDKPEPFAVTREVARQWKNYKETDEGKDFIERYKSGSDNEDEKRPVAKPLKSRVASKESKKSTPKKSDIETVPKEHSDIESVPQEHNSDSDNESVSKEQKPTLGKFRVAIKEQKSDSESAPKEQKPTLGKFRVAVKEQKSDSESAPKEQKPTLGKFRVAVKEQKSDSESAPKEQKLMFRAPVNRVAAEKLDNSTESAKEDSQIEPIKATEKVTQSLLEHVTVRRKTISS